MYFCCNFLIFSKTKQHLTFYYAIKKLQSFRIRGRDR